MINAGKNITIVALELQMMSSAGYKIENHE